MTVLYFNANKSFLPLVPAGESRVRRDTAEDIKNDLKEGIDEAVDYVNDK